MIIKGAAFDSCSACSPPILDEYKRNEWEFIKRALNDKGYVEHISGLDKIQKAAEKLDDGDIEWDDDDGDGELI